jgi:hypothetical protein
VHSTKECKVRGILQRSCSMFLANTSSDTHVMSFSFLPNVELSLAEIFSNYLEIFWINTKCLLLLFYFSKSCVQYLQFMFCTPFLIYFFLCSYRKLIKNSLTILSTIEYKSMEVRHHMCGDSRCGNVNSFWWFVLCWLYKTY